MYSTEQGVPVLQTFVRVPKVPDGGPVLKPSILYKFEPLSKTNTLPLHLTAHMISLMIIK